MHQVSSAITAMEARIEREDDEEKARKQRQETAKGERGVLTIDGAVGRDVEDPGIVGKQTRSISECEDQDLT